MSYKSKYMEIYISEYGIVFQDDSYSKMAPPNCTWEQVCLEGFARDLRICLVVICG